VTAGFVLAPIGAGVSVDAVLQQLFQVKMAYLCDSLASRSGGAVFLKIAGSAVEDEHPVESRPPGAWRVWRVIATCAGCLDR
jgi:hypothetical protein